MTEVLYSPKIKPEHLARKAILANMLASWARPRSQVDRRRRGQE